MIFYPLTETTYASDEGYTLSLTDAGFGMTALEARCGARVVHKDGGHSKDALISKATQACRDDLAQARAA